MTRYRFIRILSAILVVAALAGVISFFLSRSSESTDKHTSKSPTTQSDIVDETTAEPAFDKQKYSLTDPSSLWVIANKQRPLSPVDYAPELTVPNIPLRLASSANEMHVSSQMKPALETMVAAAKEAGLQLMLASGYRSYQDQVAVYNAEVRRNGQAAADRVSARPGHSEHQTGLAVDLEPASRQCEIQTCFGEMTEGKWLAEHAHKYGFIIRYPNGSESTTGYSYEPWHLRYVGTELSNELQKQGSPLLETFFGLSGAPNY